MIWKIIIGFFAIVIFTFVGYFSIWHGGVQFEATGQKNLYLIVGKILLWPVLLWGWIQSFIVHEQKTTSFYLLGISQFVGYFLLFFVLDKLYEFWKKK